MVQWINILRDNGFVNPVNWLPLLCEKTGAVAIVESAFMAGWLLGRPLGR